MTPLKEHTPPPPPPSASQPSSPPGTAGIDDPYEEPDAAELVLDARDTEGNMQSAEDMAAAIMAFLEEKGYLTAPAAAPEAATA